MRFGTLPFFYPVLPNAAAALAKAETAFYTVPLKLHQSTVT